MKMTAGEPCIHYLCTDSEYQQYKTTTRTALLFPVRYSVPGHTHRRIYQYSQQPSTEYQVPNWYLVPVVLMNVYQVRVHEYSTCTGTTSTRHPYSTSTCTTGSTTYWQLQYIVLEQVLRVQVLVPGTRYEYQVPQLFFVTSIRYSVPGTVLVPGTGTVPGTEYEYMVPGTSTQVTGTRTWYSYLYQPHVRYLVRRTNGLIAIPSQYSTQYKYITMLPWCFAMSQIQGYKTYSIQ